MHAWWTTHRLRDMGNIDSKAQLSFSRYIDFDNDRLLETDSLQGST
jgi:hypothetical protein